ncbi:MAG TPA: TonB-dependent receptor, partial [Acidobacteriaceae bacterium]|nr:TonB-dependent receptor [Acidobacteriaceae bacterium]
MHISQSARTHRVAMRAALLVFVLMVFSATILAQNSSSGVNGEVTDPAGAVIPGAQVALTNVATSVQRKTVTNSTGNYFFTAVPPANYTLTVTATGFQKQTITEFSVGVAQIVTINPTLRLGSVSQSVTVQASGTQVESSTAQLGTVISEKTVADLPLDGRNFTQLLDLTPGVTPISTGQNSSASNTDVVSGSDYSFPSINGAYNRSTTYLLDGINDNQAWYNTYAVPPIIDTIQEFKINSHNDAEYGGSLGGVVNISTKSGTNLYHGTAWEYVRSSTFDARPFISAPASYHLNTFGGQMGGPVRIPWLYNGRDRTFFEIGFEGTHYSRAGSRNILIPTARQLGESTFGGPQDLKYGDFSSTSTGVTKGGNCLSTDAKADPYPCQLYDPTIANDAPTPSRPAYAGNQIPVAEMSRSSLAFI